jgi:hypothetical protein
VAQRFDCFLVFFFFAFLADCFVVLFAVLLAAVFFAFFDFRGADVFAFFLARPLADFFARALFVLRILPEFDPARGLRLLFGAARARISGAGTATTSGGSGIRICALAAAAICTGPDSSAVCADIFSAVDSMAY